MENSGALLAADDLSINGNAATLTISNREQGIIQAGSDADDVLTLTHADLTLNNLDAAALLGGELQINAANLDNEGAIAGGRSNSSLVTVTTALDNAGQILFGVDPDGQGPLAGIGSGTLRTAGTLTNQVDASIQAFDDLILELTGALNNAGVVAADNVVVVGSNLAIDNQIGGVLQGFTSLGFSGSILSLQNASGAGVYGLTNNLNLASLNNQGDLFGGDIDIDITNTLTNSGTIVLGTLGAAQTRRVSANTLDNLAGGIIQSNSSLSLALTGTLLDNAGTLRGVDDLGISSTGTTLVINNTGQAAIQAGASAGDVLSISHPALTINNLGPSATLSGNQVLITAAALSNAGGILSGTSNASSIAISGALNNTGDIAIGWDPDGAQNPAPAAGSGVISAGTLTNSGSGVIQSVDDLTVRLGISLSNLGAMLSRDTLTIEGSGATLAVSNQAQGIIQAGSDAGDVLNINHAALTLSNLDDGRLLGNEIQIDAASLANAAGAAIAAGTSANSLIAVSTGLQNDGQISFGRDPDGAVGALSGTGSGTVRTAGTLTNTAGSSIQAFDNLRLELNGTLTNAGLVAADAVTIVGTNLAIVNQTNGVLQGFNSLNFSGSIASLQNAIGAGIYGLMQDLTLASLTNAGDLFGSAIDLSITNLLTNSGSILLGAAGSGNTRTVSAGTLDNQGTGTIQSNAGLLLAVSGSSLDNSGALLAADDLTVTGTGASLTLTNLSNGFIQSGSDFGDTLSLGGTALTLDNQASAQLIGNQIQIASASLSNAGVIAAGAFANNSGQAASSTITSATGFNNSGNIYFGNGTDGGSGTVNAATLDNTSTGVIQSVDTLAMNIATTLNNAGIVVSNDSFTVNGTGAALTINNNGSGVMQAGSDTGDILTLSHAALDLNNSASTAALVGNEIQISAASLQNQGSIASGTSTGSVIAVSSALTNAGNIIFGKDPDGAGAVEGSGSGTLQTSGTLTNQANASIQAFDNLTLTLAGTLTNAGAVLADAVVISGASLAIDNQANGVLQGFNSLSFSSPISSLQNAAGGGIYGLVQNLSLNSLTNNGDLFGSAIDLSISNALTNTGVILLDVNGAGSNATRNISAGTLVNHGGGIIQSNTGLALSLTGDTLNNGGGLLLAQDALHIGGTDTTLTLSNTPQGLAGRGVIQAGAGLSFSHVNLILNNGIDAVLLGESIQISSSSMSNAGRVTATGASSSSTFNIGSLDNQFDGNIQAANNLTINTNAATALTNRGDIAAHGVLSVSNSAGALNNLGNQAQIYGDQLLITVSSVNNEGTLAGGASSASAIMSTGLVDNTGNIYFSRDSDGAGPNPASGSGSLSASALTIASGSRIVAADNLTLNLQSQLNNTGVVSADTLRINASGASLQINNFAGTATNETVLSGNILELGGPGSISGLINETNAGIYGLNSNLSLDSLNNQGGLFGRDINVDVTNALTNSGNIVLGTGQINVVRRVSAGTLNNQAGGLIQSNSTLQLSLSGSTLSNAGTLLAMDDLEIVSSAAALTVNNEGANAFMQAGTAVDDLVIIQGSGITLNNLNSAVLLGGNIFFNIKEMTNSGRIAVGALLNGSSSTINTSLFVDNTLTNSGQINFGNSTDGGNGTIRANSLINLAGASIEAFGGLNLNLETTLNNSDLIEALVLSINADVNGGGLSIINNDAAVNSVLRGRNALNLSGPISSIVNGIGAGIYGVNTNLVAGSLNNQGDLFGSNIDIDITGELRNSGTLYWGTQGALGPLPDLRTLSVGTLVNLGSGIIQSTAPLDVTVRGGALTNYGTLRSDFALGIVGSDVVLDIINGDANATTTAFIVADTSSAQQGAVNIGASGTTVSLTNHTDGVVLGNTLNLTLSNLTNNGLIQGNQTGTLSVTNTLQNAGGISFGSTGFAGTGTITASVLNNTGTGELASSHLLNLNLGSSLDNANRILADTQITVNTSGAGLALINSGLLLSDLIVMNGPGLSSLTNAATGGIYGLNSSLSLNSLNNAGEIFGREIDLNIATTLTNSGQIWLNQNNANSAQTITVGSAITNQAGGIIRSGTDSAGLNFVFTNGNGVFSNSGQIFADQLALSGSNLAISNLGTGIIQGASSLNFGSSVASLQNASGAAINGLSSNLSLASLTNQGDLYGRAMDLTVTGELNNSGTIVLDWGADAAITNQQRSINAGTLVNQVGSTIQSFTGLNISLTGNAFNNFGTLLADDALQISGSGASLTLTNGNGTDNAYLQAGGQLSISPTASALTLNNMANATIYGDSLLLNTTANLSNAGRIQALNGSQLTVGTLTNTDTILLSANGSTQSFLNANILNNNAGGSLVSVGSSALNVTSQLNNIGDIDVFDALSIASFGPPTQLAVDIQGDVTVGGLFSMAANGGVAAPNVIVNTSGRIDAQTANFDLGALEIMDGGVVVVSGTTDITATTLLMNGVDSQLIGNRSGISTGQGLFTLTATNAIDNFGLIASGHDLLINANAGLRNRANAGVGAGGNNQIEFNTGGILNEGDIYGGSIQLAQMTAGSSAEVVENAESGKLDATSGVMIISNANGGFFNYGQARATGNITIAATNFTNGLRGNYSRTSVDANPVDPNGNSPPPFPYNNPPFWYDNAATQIQFEPWIALNETEIRAGSLQRPHALRNLRQEVWDTANGSDTPNYAQGPARIVSDANLSVTTNDGRNQYGILSGENVTISATGSNASFINDDLHLDTTADFYSGSLVEYGFIRNANGDIFIGADIDNPNIGGDEDATYSFDANGDIIETITSTGISSVVTDRFYAATYEGALDYGAVLRNVAVRPVGAANGRLDREKIPATSPVTTGIFANGSIVISGGFSVTNINTPYYPENGTTSATLNSLITAATTPSVEAPSNTSVGAGGNTAGTATDPSAGGGTPNESFTDPSGGTAGAADTSNQGGTGQSDYSGGASGGNGTFAGVSADYNVDAINPAGGTGSNDQSPGGSDPNSVNGPGSQNQNVTVGSGVNGAFVPGATDPTGVGGTQQQDNDPQGGSGLGNNAGGQVDGLDVGVGLVAFNGTPAIDSAAAVGVADERVSLIELSGFVPASELPPVPALELLEEQTDLNLGSTALTLPTSPNGLFVPAENIQAGFLIETNTVFDDGSNAVGSDELAEELGLDPELLQLRLGDAAYENYIIRDQITAQTNVGVLTGYQNQDQMITSLYASAAEASQDFGLVWGEALSQEQQNSLQEDIVWMVETEVGGVRVLAPVVYLSQATKLAYQNGSGMVASNVVMDVENFNNRGTVQGSNAVIIETTQGLTNQSGGTIAGNFVVLESTEGSIENANNASIIGGSSISMNANQDISNAGNVISRNIGMTAEEGGIRNAGSIRAAETAFIKGNTDVDNSRGNISGQNVFVEAVEGGIKTGGINATNTAALTARTDITVGSVEARDVGLTSHEGAVGIEFGSVTGTNSVDLSQRQSIDTTKAASNINTRNLGLTSTGGGVNLSGVDGADQSLRVQSRDDIINRDNTLESNVLSLRSTEGDISNQGGALIGTERLSLDARKDINNIGGQLSGGDVFLNAREGSITSQTLTRTTQTHGNVELGDRASITATNNLGMKAGEDINLIGSETRAGGNARFDAAGNINLLSVETRKTTSRGVESSLGNGDKTTSSVTNVGSLLDVGGTLSAEAGSEINVLGSQLNAGNAKLSAGSAINVKAVKDSVGTDTNVSRRGRFSSSESSVQTFDETVKSSGINVDGTLVMDSGKLINIEGSEVNAGQAALKSGGNIIIQSVEERHDSTVSTTKKQFIGGSSSTVVTKNGEQFGSSVNVDDALTVSSDGNTTIAASDVNVGGDFFANTGGDFTVEDRKSEKSVDTKTERSGFGVGGGMYGTQKTSDLIEESTSRGSTLNIGGSGAILSDNDVNVRGSNIDIGKDAFIDAKRDINVMDSQDTRTQTTRTETTTILAVDSSSSTGTNAQAGAEADKGNFSANASAEVGAEASNNTDISLLKTTVTNEYSYKETSRGSSIKSGGDMVLTAGETIRLKGSSLDATDNMFMESENLEVTTGRNIDISTSDTTIQKIGIFTENDASAGAEASATASLKSAKARAGASAGVEASNTTTIGYKREREETESYSLENVSSSIKSGGSTVIDVKDRAKFVGANVEAGGDIHIEAGELENLAAVDIESTDTKSSMHMGGLYVGGEASASAEAEAKAGPTGVKATAGAEASAEATAGLRYTDSHSSSSEGSTTNVVNTFSAGGNITRNVKGTIRDQGTRLAAGGNINQKATNIIEDEIRDTAWSDSSDSSRDARIGLYAGAGAEASAGGEAGLSGKSQSGVKSDASASVGLQFSYTDDSEQSKNLSTKAVTSSYTAGGNITSTSTERSKFVGSNMKAGGEGGISLSGDTVDFLAAKDTTQQSASQRSIEASGKVALIGGDDVELGAGYSQQKSNSQSSTARVGSLSAENGSVKISSRGDTNLVGVEIDAGKNVDISSSEGSTNLLAARSTAEEHREGFSISVSTSSSGNDSGGKDSEGALGFGYNRLDTASVKNTGVKIKAGNGVNLSANDKVLLEGTKVKSGKDGINISADSVELREAKDTTKTLRIGVGIDLEGSKSTSGPGGTSPDGGTDAAGNPTTASDGSGQPGAPTPASSPNDDAIKALTGATSDGAESGAASPANDDDEPEAVAGISLDFGYVDKKDGQVTELQSDGKININARKVVNQEAKLQAAEGVDMQGEEEKLERSDKNVNINLKTKFKIKSDTFKKKQEEPAADDASATDDANTASSNGTGTQNVSKSDDGGSGGGVRQMPTTMMPVALQRLQARNPL
ncbi:MAG: hemagglutinin repeat-containing protein, partial [Oceanococcus sp.]